MDVKEGRTVKGIQFENIRDAGDPVELAQHYVNSGADELVFLDITATLEKRRALTKLVERVASEITIPFTVGGGIKSLDDAKAIIDSGADKISLNSSAILKPELIETIARYFGSQCVVLAIDTKFNGNEWMVFRSGGKIATNLRTIDWVKKAAALGAGEILLTSMNHDGVGNGFALDIVHAVSAAISIPVIASGGAGTKEHFRDVFTHTNSTGALAASVFHFGQIQLPELKHFLKTQNIPVRL